VVIDCRAHMLGRLASVLAKELLAGQHIVSASSPLRPLPAAHSFCVGAGGIVAGHNASSAVAAALLGQGGRKP